MHKIFIFPPAIFLPTKAETMNLLLLLLSEKEKKKGQCVFYKKIKKSGPYWGQEAPLGVI